MTADTGRPKPRRFDWWDVLDGAGGLAGPANVIMQLSHPGVGYGVVESRVDSGKATLHPFKRARTTGTYLAVAAVGTPEQRRAYRKAVNGSHVQVQSDDTSPEPYNAFDPALQLWVAACLYRGLADMYEILRGPLDDATADQFYREAARLGTTLQMRADRWPADRVAFEKYWDEMTRTLRMDEPVRSYLDDLIHLRHRPRATRALLGPVVVFFTTGFLPEQFRELMGMSWADADQRRFDRAVRLVAGVNRLLPKPVRRFPANAYLLDLRVRMRLGRRLV
jgi:uncharacterized protein (DUF2236 family)